MKKKRTRWILLSILVLLIIGRLLLPYFVLKYVNRQLSAMDGYYGHVEDIDIALIRGAYVINDIKIWAKEEGTNKTEPIPVFDTRAIDLSVEWKALLKGAIVGEIEAQDPKVNFVKKPETTTDRDLQKDTTDFRQLIKSLMPLKINRFEVNNGEVHYIDKLSDPKLDISMREIHILATNLTNANDSNKLLPSRAEATATAYDGKINVAVNLNALEKYPTFDLNAELTNLNLVKLNDFLRAYGNVDVKKGNFSLYTEAAATDGKYKGYVKPLIKDLDIVQWNKEEGNLAQIAWETLVASGAEIVQNQRKEQLGTKLPLEGSFVTAETDIGIWKAITNLLRNAFISALAPTIDRTIDISAVNNPDAEDKTLLEKIFDKKKDKKEDGDNDKKDKKKK